MAVLFITHKFPPSVGGMQKQSYELINGIRNFEKTYTLIHSPGESKFLFFLVMIWKIRRMLAQHDDIKVIHCNDGVVASICAFFISWINVPVTATIHGLDIVFPNLVFQRCVVPRLRKLEKVFAVSEATAWACLERGFRKDQVVVIHNGVDVDISNNYRYESEIAEIENEYDIDIGTKKILLSVGRAVRRKGFSWFVNNVMPLCREDVIYIIIGPISSPSFMMSAVLKVLPRWISRQIELFLGWPSDNVALNRALDGGPRCFHTGKIPNSHMLALLRRADLFVMPNIRVKGDMEGFGLVALEANLSGTFVLGAEIDGITCAVSDGLNGKLIPSGDALVWAKEINELVSHPEKLQNYSDRALEFVEENFSWDKMVQEYLSEFRQFDTRQVTVNSLLPALQV